MRQRLFRKGDDRRGLIGAKLETWAIGSVEWAAEQSKSTLTAAQLVKFARSLLELLQDRAAPGRWDREFESALLQRIQRGADIDDLQTGLGAHRRMAPIGTNLTSSPCAASMASYRVCLFSRATTDEPRNIHRQARDSVAHNPVPMASFRSRAQIGLSTVDCITAM
jgi:hypothetical protein